MSVSQTFSTGKWFSTVTGKSYETQQEALAAESGALSGVLPEGSTTTRDTTRENRAYNQDAATQTAIRNRDHFDNMRAEHDPFAVGAVGRDATGPGMGRWGSLLGGIAGTLIAPGVGTSIGAGLGGLVGGVADEQALTPRRNTSQAADTARETLAQQRSDATRTVGAAEANAARYGTPGGATTGVPGGGAGIDYGGLLEPTNLLDANRDGNRSALRSVEAGVAANQADRATSREDIESRINAIGLDTGLADSARQDQQAGLDMQRELFARIQGSDGGINSSVNDIVGRYDSLALDTGLADQSRGEQLNAIDLNRGLLDEIRSSQGRFDETANELTSRYDAINVDTTGLDESRGFQLEGLDQQRALLDRLMRDDADVLSGQYSNRALANQLAMARGASGGAGAQQLSENRVNDNSASVYAAAQQEANQQILQQLGLAGGVASAFGSQAQGVRNLDLGQADLLSSVDLQKAQGVAQAKQTALNQLLESQGITGNIGASIGQQAGVLRSADETRTRTQAELDQAAAAGVAQARQRGIDQQQARDVLSSDIATAFGNQTNAIRNADESRAVSEADIDLRATNTLADFVSNQQGLAQEDVRMLGQFDQAARQFDIDWARLDQSQRETIVDAILREAGLASNERQAKIVADGLAYRFDATREDTNAREDQRRQDIRAKASQDQINTLLLGIAQAFN
jgi:hypothetical protein